MCFSNREQVDITDQIVRLSEEKLDLLRAGCYASETGTSRAADKANAAIQDLRVLIQGSGNSTLKKKSLRSFEDADVRCT